MAEDKARNRVESSDPARERNAVSRPHGPAVARMDSSNGLTRASVATMPFVHLIKENRHGGKRQNTD